MKVICSNCAAPFEDTFSKCPYCGMIYEPAAEREYGEKLEDIRQKLEETGECVVSNFKSELIRFCLGFFISLTVVLSLFFVVMRTAQKREAVQREEALDELDKKLRGLAGFTLKIADCNTLYENGNYEEMCKALEEVRRVYLSELTRWKHYYFYSVYQNYQSGKRYLEDEKNSGKMSTFSFSRVLYHCCNMYCVIYNKQDTSLSYRDKETLTKQYEALKNDISEYYCLSETEFEEIRGRLIVNNSTYVGYTDCEKIAEERLGKMR